MYILHCFKVDDPGTYNFGLIGDLVLHGSGSGFVILNFRIKGQFLIAFSAILGQCLQTKGVGHKLDPVTQQCFKWCSSFVSSWQNFLVFSKAKAKKYLYVC